MDSKQRTFLDLNLDPRKTILICGEHHYTPGGPRMPVSDCADCWFAFLFHHISQLPPHKQQEKIEELEMVLRNAYQCADEGNYDFVPYDRPRIEVIKGTEN